MNWKQHGVMKLLWTLLRLYTGWQWLSSGLEKNFGPGSEVWVGAKAGAAVTGFLQGALAKTTGAHPDVQWWYAYFIQHVALPNAKIFTYLVAWGELLVGIALILGIFTTAALLGGLLMNLNYLLAGTVSINPILLVCEALLLWAGPAAYYWGVDRLFVSRFKT